MLKCAQPCAAPATALPGSNPFTRESVMRAFEAGSASLVAASYRQRERCFRGFGASAGTLERDELGIRRAPAGAALLPEVLALLASPESPCPATSAVLEADVRRRRSRTLGATRTAATSSEGAHAEGTLAWSLERNGYATFNRSFASAIAAQLRERGGLEAVGKALGSAPSRHGVTSLSLARVSSGWPTAGQRSAVDVALRPLLRHALPALQEAADAYLGPDSAYGGVVLLRLAGRNLTKREYGSGMW